MAPSDGALAHVTLHVSLVAGLLQVCAVLSVICTTSCGLCSVLVALLGPTIAMFASRDFHVLDRAVSPAPHSTGCQYMRQC
jgi:hypothetical protein